MNDQTHNFPDTETPRDWLAQGMAMQAIEGNPLSVADVAMFEMFEAEGWSPEKCRAHILAQAIALR